MPVHSASSRRSIRLPRYDYSQSGCYFFTLCIIGHKSILGRVNDYKMGCNLAGGAVADVWHALPMRFPTVELDAFVVMPNHVHGILCLSSDKIQTGQRPAGRASPAPTNAAEHANRTDDPCVARRPPARTGDSPVPVRPTLGQIIGAFKSLSSVAVNRVFHRAGSVWQRNYYEHIVRSAADLDAIRLYISENPAQWQNDRENPLARNPASYSFEPLNPDQGSS